MQKPPLTRSILSCLLLDYTLESLVLRKLIQGRLLGSYDF